MKTATIPSVRVEPELRDEVVSLLREGETLSEFVEQSVREAARRRRDQAEFVARGMVSLATARGTGVYVDADAVVKRLERKVQSLTKKKSPSR